MNKEEIKKILLKLKDEVNELEANCYYHKGYMACLHDICHELDIQLK